MSILSSFTEDERTLIVSLPYKVGLWVSYADDVDGERDDELEEKSMLSCIKAVAGLHDDEPFIKEVSAEALRRRNDWPQWAEQAFFVPKEAAKVAAIIGKTLPADKVKNYKAMLMEIGSAVARASGEFDAFDEEEEGGFGALIGKIVGGFSGLSQDDKNHPMNVSASESAALNELRTILKGD